MSTALDRRLEVLEREQAQRRARIEEERKREAQREGDRERFRRPQYLKAFIEVFYPFPIDPPSCINEHDDGSCPECAEWFVMIERLVDEDLGDPGGPDVNLLLFDLFSQMQWPLTELAYEKLTNRLSDRYDPVGRSFG